LTDDFSLPDIGADSGSTATLVGRSWLDEQNYEASIDKWIDRSTLPALSKPLVTEH